MSGAATTGNCSELKIATSTFDGDREKAHSWLLKTTAYLDINKHHYDTDEKKIVFTTGHMSKGPTAKWSEDLLETTQTRIATTAGTTAPRGYGTWVDFVTTFKANFEPVDLAGSSMTKLMKLKQVPGELADYIAEFRQLCVKVKITEDVLKIQFFMDGLHHGLISHLYNSTETPSATFEATITKILHIEGQRLKLQAVNECLGFNHPPQKKKNYGSSRYSTPSTGGGSRDPNAMEVDQMTDAECEEHSKSGKCFTCHQTGHRSKNCPKKTGDARKNYKGKQPVRQLPEEEAKKEDSEEDEDRFEEVDEEVTEVKRMQDF
jgi:hypothetical protein